MIPKLTARVRFPSPARDEPRSVVTHLRRGSLFVFWGATPSPRCPGGHRPLTLRLVRFAAPSSLRSGRCAPGGGPAPRAPLARPRSLGLLLATLVNLFLRYGFAWPATRPAPAARESRLVPSTRSDGNCFDNRMRVELLYRQAMENPYRSRQHSLRLPRDLPHNRQRRHSALGMRTPFEYEILYPTRQPA